MLLIMKYEWYETLWQSYTSRFPQKQNYVGCCYVDFFVEKKKKTCIPLQNKNSWSSSLVGLVGLWRWNLKYLCYFCFVIQVRFGLGLKFHSLDLWTGSVFLCHLVLNISKCTCAALRMTDKEPCRPRPALCFLQCSAHTVWDWLTCL